MCIIEQIRRFITIKYLCIFLYKLQAQRCKVSQDITRWIIDLSISQYLSLCVSGGIFQSQSHNISTWLHRSTSFHTSGYLCIEYVTKHVLQHQINAGQLLWSYVLSQLRHFANKSFHQGHERLQAVCDGLQTVHEPVLCIGINGNKRSF